MTNRNCSGCLTYTGYIYGTDPICIMTEENRGDCPCAKCIVKMMCDEACYRFERFKLEKEAIRMSKMPRTNPFIKGGI